MKRLFTCILFIWPLLLSAQSMHVYGDLIINEVMANPVGLTLLPETEYVELYNTTDQPVSLKDWTFIYIISESSATTVIFPDTILPANGYAVLFRAGRDILTDPGSLALPIPNFPANLANTGKQLQLKDPTAIIIDSITYTAAKAAQSWERATDASWYLSTDTRGGTPGAINSPQEPPEPPIVIPPDHSNPGDIIINEVMANPVGLTLLPETEYVEIYNASGTAMPLYNWTFIYDGKVFAIPDTILQAGQYAILYRTGYDIYVEPGGIALSVEKFPVLANTGKAIGIVNSHGTSIDAVNYASAKAARAWEQATDGTWHLSTDTRGGTPGAVNSPQESTEPPEPPEPPVVGPPDHSKPGDIIINEVMANPVGLTLLPETEYVEIYNASGTAMPLYNWAFTYDGKIFVIPDTTLQAGQYAILYRTGYDIYVEPGGMALPVEKFPVLANTGKAIGIVNSHGTSIDAVNYASAKAARAWERATDGTWYLSTDTRGGTPGAVNSPQESTEPPEPPVVGPPDHSKPGDIIINEVMANPVGLTLLPETEYVEIYNASGTAMPLYNWTFIYDGKAFVIPDTTLQAGQYAVLYRTGYDIYVEPGGMTLPVEKFPVLANTGKKIGIVNSHGTEIDTVSYAGAKAARAWERATDGTWHLSTDTRGGTPGAVNSSQNTEKPPIDPEEPIQTDSIDIHDLVINEIMANPVGLTDLPETEYIEIYNASGRNITLKGCRFVYDNRKITLPDTILPADRYAVLFREGRDIYIDATGIALPISDFPANLANTGKTILIYSSSGSIVDSLTYAAAKAARSWERDNDGMWYLSTDPRGGTPGATNSPKESVDPPVDPQPPVDPENPTDTLPPGLVSVEAGMLIFNELLPDPFAGGCEYIELYNRSDQTISVKNVSVATRKTDGTLSTRYSLASITNAIEPNSYIVLCTSKEGVLDFYYTPDPATIHELKLPVLNNTGATLVLFRTNDEFVIDQVTYSSKWHNEAIKNTKGVALERISPEADTQSAANWISATAMAGYGTPGYKNSQYATAENEQGCSLSGPEYDPMSGEYTITYQTDQPGYRCRIEVYTIEGRKTAEIVNNQLIGTNGDIRWNGTGLNGSRLHSGLYVFYAEIYHPNGQTKRYKQTLLVR